MNNKNNYSSSANYECFYEGICGEMDVNKSSFYIKADKVMCAAELKQKWA